MTGYWIQRHDYSAEDVSESSFEQTIKAFNNFDWELELSQFKENVEGKDCPPGIGVTNGKPLDEKGGFLLHICPIDKNRVFFSFHFQKPSSFFGISMGTSAEVHHVDEYPRSEASSLIKQFYDEKYDHFLEIE